MKKLESLFEDYIKFTELRSSAIAKGRLDLSGIKWFSPTLLLPLGVFIKQNRYIDLVLPKDRKVSNYFDIITENNSFSKNRSYIPIIKIPKNESELEIQLKKLNNLAIHCGGTTPLQYFIGELVDNIYQHSIFSTAYIMAQRYQKLKLLEFCILDNGISIPQSYENNGFTIESDKDALDYALKGISTKREEGRGFGLRSSINLLASHMNGTCLIISRRGALCANKQHGKESFEMPENYIYFGTIISISIPLLRTEVEIYDYIE
ncbi:Uncharacterised protein [uncultured archaeon]|nr:Uncharacterised protein [uncultured archaeon]